MTTETKPQATQRTRQKWRILKKPNKIRVHAGEETVRTAFCPIHHVNTSLFAGVNEHGWVFGCNGLTAAQTKKATDEEKAPGHYFIAEPAK